MQKILSIIFFFFISLNLYSVDILSVTRDFIYPNIFLHKEELIGKSSVNKFSFGYEDADNKELPEFFLIEFKIPKNLIGSNIRVTFEYKQQNSKELKSVTKEILLKKQKNNVQFIFSGDSNKKDGRVELWTVKIKDNNGSFLAERKSVENRWRN